MKEYRFKILREGDLLHDFNRNEIIIAKSGGDFHVHKIFGFEEEIPVFSKDFESISVCKSCEFNENIVVIRQSGEFRVYKLKEIAGGIPVFNENFCIVVTRGIGKIDVYDTVSEIKFMLPARGE